MEERPSTTSNRLTWFWKWFLNNQIVTVLLIMLLLLLNLLIFTRIAYLLNPISEIFSIIGFPIVGAGIIYYMVKPLFDWMLKKKVPKIGAILLIFGMLIVIVWAALFSLIPLVEKQLSELISQAPRYYAVISEQIQLFMRSGAFSELQTQLNRVNMDFLQSLTTRLNGILNVTVSGIGSVVFALSDLVIGLITIPIILYYLLQDGDKLLPTVLKVFPTRSRNRMGRVLSEMNQQISSYIRGQLTVAIAVAIMFMIGYAIIGLPYGMTIAILAGALNVIPYVGSFFGILPALVVGIVISPMMFIQVFIVFIIEQTLEGRIISPLILGSSLQIHPVTILVVLLTTGKMFGLVGLIFGVPGYAVLKVLVTHLFDWYQQYSGLYSEISEKEDKIVKEIL